MSDEHTTANGLQAQCAELQAENQHLRRQLTQLRQEQERLQYALEGSNDGTWDWFIRENQAVLSDRYREMLGYRPDELPDSVDSWLNSIHPDDMPTITQTVEEYLAGKREEYVVEHRLRHKSGEWRWMLSRGKIVARDADGQPLRMTGTISDITERKQQEAELHQLKALIENAPNGFVMADMHGMITYANPAYYQCVGWDHSLLGHPVMTNLDEDPEHVDDLMQQVMAEGNWQGELRYRRKDGSTFPGQASSFIVYDSHGQPQAIAGIMRDITEQKQAEERLRTFKTLVENAIDGIAYATPDGILRYSNPAYATITGFGERVIGSSIADYYEPDVAAFVAETVMPTVARTGNWQGVLRLRRPDGEIWMGQTSVVGLRNAADELVLYMATFRDVTKQLADEEERAALQQQVIDAQRNALRELSTPLIPISDDVVIMPLIGTIDSQRARQVMETLLTGVAHHQASLAILDITGVSVVDTQVAQAFIQAAQAVKLLGAEVMLTGIQPQIAQTLVHLGVDLRGIQTQSSLQAGIAAAL